MQAPKFGTQRRHQRLQVALPATLKVGNHSVAASIRDISVGGLFVFTDTPFREGSEIEIVLMLPKELGLPASEMVCCHGKIVRAELSAGHCGIAAEIERYQAFPQA
jgi:Tfp pilus assembly protein PilZ